MRLGKRTAKLVAEAIVLAHARGAQFGKFDPDWTGNRENYPADSVVIDAVLHDAKSFKDIYPTLSQVERE